MYRVVKTAVGGHNVRRAPSFDDNVIIGRLVAGNEFEVLRQAGRWYQIAGTIDGWMYQTSALQFVEVGLPPVIGIDFPTLEFLATHPELDAMIELIDVVLPAFKSWMLKARELRDHPPEA